VVEPSTELVKHLRADNYLSLLPVSAMEVPSESPEWFAFKPDDMDILQASVGRLRLCFSKANQLLYATDHGGGFTPSVEMPAVTAMSHSNNPGRLSPSAPPNPERP
jgi:hypothetical protein